MNDIVKLLEMAGSATSSSNSITTTDSSIVDNAVYPILSCKNQIATTFLGVGLGLAPTTKGGKFFVPTNQHKTLFVAPYKPKL